MISADGAEPPSPCVRICAVDPATRICGGCSRTLDEISAWFTAGAAEKHAILRAVAARQSVSVRSR
ncbi:DUF1289 domain-containing protein [Novosphingobium sp. KCTC 2891]|uniref:DUF1289 domain-containing protein n=1 Tax=Novosphingobium sp. KCTC 2891 TaxID=2989730 RepID=UPI0022217156|nr:DUF1289 domain-containing protein [Novosphingobium sp. KCTC 2891]MCW1382105.1 DUF1289 domain-containing protein [Novosphingobium sp. KCTC 2891]